jgi:hypothetical protein
MIGLFCYGLAVLASPFKSKLRLEAENAVLRQQLIVLRRRLHGRVRLTKHDRWLFIQLYRWFPSILTVLTILRPETLVRWHRAGFSCYWRWESRPRGGRPQIDTELRALSRRISMENPLWGKLVWINVTANPTAEWVARQITEAFPWDEAPHYLIRDRDRIYGSVVTRRLRAMGIRQAYRTGLALAEWFAERLVGSIRCECVVGANGSASRHGSSWLA